jgi:hypothetical protein
MPTPKQVKSDIAAFLNANDKAAARTALEAETAGAAAAVAAAKQDASADLTAYADAADAAARRALIGAADAATNTGDEDTASILDKLKGAAEDPDRIGAEYLPETLEVDYVELQDQTGLEIPDHSLGRKGDELYFGNSPVLTPNQRFSGSISTGVSTLGTFNIPAAVMVEAGELWLELDLHYFTSVSGVDNPKVGILFNFDENGADDLSTGAWLYIPQPYPCAGSLRLRMKLVLSDIDGLLPDFSELTAGVELIQSGTGSGLQTITGIMHGNSGTLIEMAFAGGATAAQPAIATIKIGVFPDGEVNTSTVTFVGSCLIKPYA